MVGPVFRTLQVRVGAAIALSAYRRVLESAWRRARWAKACSMGALGRFVRGMTIGLDTRHALRVRVPCC